MPSRLEVCSTALIEMWLWQQLLLSVLPNFFPEDVSLIQYTSRSKLDELAASVWSFLELWIHHGIDVTASQVDNLLDREEFASLAEVGSRDEAVDQYIPSENEHG